MLFYKIAAEHKDKLWKKIWRRYPKGWCLKSRWILSHLNEKWDMQCLIYTVYYIYYILIENRFSNIILSQGKNCFKSRPRKLLYPQVFHPIESQALRSYPKPWTKISNPITLSFPNQFQMIYKPSTWTSMQIPIVAPPQNFPIPKHCKWSCKSSCKGSFSGKCVCFFGREPGMQPISAYDSRTKVQLMIHCAGNCSLPTEWIAVAATSLHCFSFEFVLRSKSVANCDWTRGQLVYEMKAKIRPKWGKRWVEKPFGWRQIAFCNGKHQPRMSQLHGEQNKSLIK